MTPADSDELNGPLMAPEPLQPAGVPTSPPPESTLWNWADLLIFLFFTALALLASYFAVVVGYVAINTIEGSHALSQGAQDSPVLSLAFLLVFYILLFGLIYFLVAIYHQRPFWPSIQWRRPTALQVLAYLFGGFLLAVIVELAPTLLPDTDKFPLEQMFSSANAAYAVAVFAVLVAPFMEELIFRGILFAIFEKRVNLTFAIAATALLFGALHIREYGTAWNHTLMIFFVGAVFSTTRGLTRSLAPSVILHIAYNLSLMAGLYFSTNHFRAFGIH